MLELSLISSNTIQLDKFIQTTVGFRGPIPFSLDELTKLKSTLATKYVISYISPNTIQLPLDCLPHLCTDVFPTLETIPHEVLQYANCKRYDDTEAGTYISQTSVQSVLTMPNVTLKEYQLESVRRILSRPRVLLALTMGLGKTLISIVAIAMLRAQLQKTSTGVFKVLVVCPASLRLNWISECDRFCNHLGVVHIQNGKSIHLCGSVDITVIGYTLMTMRYKEVMAGGPYTILIADEAHAIKHTESKRAKVFTSIATRIPRLVLLTGTPAQRHSELYNLLKQLDHKFFKYFHHYQVKMVTHGKRNDSKLYYGERYCIPDVVYLSKVKQALKFTRSRRSAELRYLTSHLCVRYTKDELDLPPVTSESVVVGELTQKQQYAYDAEMTRISTLRETEGTKASESALMDLIRKTSELKTPYVLKYMDVLLDSMDISCNFIMFTTTIAMQTILADYLKTRNVSYIQINGSVPMKQRTILIDSLRNGGARVGLLSLQTCSTGLNLTFTNLTIFAELSFDSIQMFQATGRTHRIGQKADTVILRYLHMRGSTDELIWKNLGTKSICSSRLLDGEADIGTYIDYHNVDIQDRKRYKLKR